MKWVVWLLLASPGVWAANRAKDREAIVKAVAALNHAKNDAKAPTDKGEIWSELSPPVIITRSVQFLTPNLARVEASRVQHGSVMSRSVPLLILLERKREGWKVTSVTEGAEAVPPPIQPARFLPQ